MSTLHMLRGFETRSYTTHTLFYATSLEQAKILARKYYDELAPLIKERDRLEIINDELRDIAYESNRKAKELNKQQLDEFFTRDVLTSEIRTTMSELQRAKQALNEFYYRDTQELVDFNNKYYNKLWSTDAFEFLETRTKTINYWFKQHYCTIETDVLTIDSYTDGD